MAAADAKRLMDLLGLSEDELCRVLDADPLTLLSGQLDHRPELPILIDLLADAEERAEGSTKVLPKRPDEFVCQSCFLVKHPSQLADPERQLCRDCV